MFSETPKTYDFDDISSLLYHNQGILLSKIWKL